MKRLIVFLALSTLLNSSFAQKGKVNSALNLKNSGKLDEALKIIDETVDPSNEKSDKTIDWPRTWEVRGEIYQAIAQSKDENLKKLDEDPLTEALNSYKKAIELDEKDRFDKSLKIKLTLLTNDLANQAVDAFNSDSYEKALRSFEQIIEINDIDLIKADNPEAVDTIYYFNAGLAAYNAGLYDKAIQYYGEAAKYGYNGARTVSLIANSYQQKKDTVGALETLKKGFERFPEDNVILENMVQIYINTNKTEDAMKYLEMAIQQDPDNARYHFAMGTLYEKIDQEDKAIATYETAIELDSNQFMAYFNIGVIYYNQGVQLFEEAKNIPPSENEAYEKALKKADKYWEKALPFMEKCYSLNPKDNSTIESLKSLYYRLNQMDKYNVIESANAQ